MLTPDQQTDIIIFIAMLPSDTTLTVHTNRYRGLFLRYDEIIIQANTWIVDAVDFIPIVGMMYSGDLTIRLSETQHTLECVNEIVEYVDTLYHINKPVRVT